MKQTYKVIANSNEKTLITEGKESTMASFETRCKETEKKSAKEVSVSQPVLGMATAPKKLIPAPTPETNQPEEVHPPKVQPKVLALEPGEVTDHDEPEERIRGHMFVPRSRYKRGTVIEISDDEEDVQIIEVPTNDPIEID